MNRRLVKPFFKKFLNLKQEKQKVIESKDNIVKNQKSINTKLKDETLVSSKNLIPPPKKSDTEKKSRPYSTNSFQEDNKKCIPLNTKLQKDSKFKVGDEASLEKQITEEDIQKFIEISGDSNPIHYSRGIEKAVVHGALLNSLVSNVIGTKLPGPGTIVTKQILNFPNKCYAGELVKVNVKVTQDRKIVKVEFECKVEDEKGTKKVVLFGEAQLIQKGGKKD